MTLQNIHQARPITAAHPLGPVAYRMPSRNEASARFLAAAVAGGCGALLAFAASLTPNPSGQGTHEQLGLPPCTMVMITGLPCPTCGMTTAFAYAARGRLAAAFQAQPAGLALALAVMAVGVLAGSVLATGKVWVVNWCRVSPMGIALIVAAAILAGWGYKIGIILVTRNS